MSPKRRESYRIDVRDQRIPGGRFSCSARTTSAPEFRKREAAVRSLIEAGALDVLARVTGKGSDKLHIADVAAAVAKGDIDGLRATQTPLPMLGAVCDRLRQRKVATRRKGTQHQVNITLDQLEAHFGVERDAKGRIVRDVRMDLVTVEQCERWLHGPKNGAKPWAPRTQGVKHAYAKQVWTLGIAAEAEAAEHEKRRPRLRLNPWSEVEPAPIHATRVIFLTAAERDALLTKLAGTPLCAFLAVAYLGGLRLGEAVHLRTGVDVDLAAGLLRVQSRPGEHAWAPKTSRGQRDVPINDTLRAILARHIADGFAGERFFFRTPRHDKPLGAATAYGWWVDAYDAAGLKHGRADVDAVVYHTGRHSFCSLLVQQGVSPLIVAELVGDTFEEVVTTYGHLTPHNLREAVKLLEGVPEGTIREIIHGKTANVA